MEVCGLCPYGSPVAETWLRVESSKKLKMPFLQLSPCGFIKKMDTAGIWGIVTTRSSP